MSSPGEVELWTPDQFKAIMDSRLGEYAAAIEQRAVDMGPYFSDHADLMRFTNEVVLSGGKRGRPYLAYVAFKGLGGVEVEPVLQVGQALEIYHNSLLFHDDIMDHDLVRHGVRNVIGKYKDIFEPQLGPEKAEDVGNSAALLAGNALAGLTIEQLNGCSLDLETKNRLIGIICGLHWNVGAGQHQDAMSLIHELSVVDMDYVLTMYKYKTALYSFDVPLKFGAIVAQAPDYTVDAFSGYAIPIGVAFQLADDNMGMFGNAEKIGKAVASDLKEGKKTLLILGALENANEEDREFIIDKLGNPEVNEEDLARVRQIIVDTGAKETVDSLIANLIEEGVTALDDIEGFSEPARAALSQLALSQVGRSV